VFRCDTFTTCGVKYVLVEVFLLKKDIHPEYGPCQVACACGNRFETRSTLKEIKVAVCSSCHPFYTGKRGAVVIEAGRVEKFQRKYAGTRFGKPAQETEEKEQG
jgi:large subunit ribosomal protein L31